MTTGNLPSPRTMVILSVAPGFSTDRMSIVLSFSTDRMSIVHSSPTDKMSIVRRITNYHVKRL